jgi:hypothetical protein
MTQEEAQAIKLFYDFLENVNEEEIKISPSVNDKNPNAKMFKEIKKYISTFVENTTDKEIKEIIFIIEDYLNLINYNKKYF